MLLESGGCPFKEHLYELEDEQGISGEILYVLFQDSNGTWRTLAVGVKDEGFKSRLPIREDWRALRDQDLGMFSNKLSIFSNSFWSFGHS